MDCTRKKKQQNKRLFSQLSGKETDLVFGQSNQDERTESRSSMTYRGTSSDSTSNPTQIIYPQVDVHTLEENIVSKVRSEVDNVMTTIKTRVQDPVLPAIANLVIPIVELAMKSANASSGRSVDGNVWDPDQSDLPGNIEGLRMTASSRMHSHTDLNKIDETRSNFTVEEGDLMVNGKNIDRQKHTHHSGYTRGDV